MQRSFEEWLFDFQALAHAGFFAERHYSFMEHNDKKLRELLKRFIEDIRGPKPATPPPATQAPPAVTPRKV